MKTDSHRHDGIGAGSLCAINRATGRQPSERGIQRLYQHRTRFAGKIEACQSVLNVLKKEKQHQQFADQKVSAYWIISSVCVQRKPEMIRR